MPDDARKKAGERLAADLRTQREERGLSTEDLRETMSVPEGLFHAFESGRLMKHPMFNRVYLRSLIRSYADATGVPSSAALSALDATFRGDYEEGRLQREIEDYEQAADASSDDASSEREEEPAEASAEEAGAEGEAGKSEEAPAEQDESTQETQEHEATAAQAGAAGGAAAEAPEQEPDWTTQSPPGASAEEAEQRQREKEKQAQARQEEREQQAQEQQREREERADRQQQEGTQQEGTQQEGTQQDRSARREEQRSRHRRRERSGGSSNAGRWIAGALALVVLAVVAFFLLRSPGGESSEAAATTATAAADTAGGGGRQAAQQDQRPAANLQLGPTMNFTVAAQGGPVQNLKVTRDQDVRRPYWIEQGHATVFPAQQRIVIENPSDGTSPLQNVRLFAEGYSYPTDRRDGQGRIVITRQAMQSFADTLRGQPAQVPAQRDTASLSGL